jgi:hypothetical protein
MPPMGCLDRSLNRLLGDLAEALAASGADQLLVQPDDLARRSAQRQCGSRANRHLIRGAAWGTWRRS